MSAQLLYKMIKSKTEYPLHKAIKVEREDVVFLYLIEMDSQVSSTLSTLLLPPSGYAIKQTLWLFLLFTSPSMAFSYPAS